MKNMKKGLAILIALTMVLAMASTAFAATVSIDAAFDEHDFVAYQIFKGVQAHETDTPDNAPLGELKWGSGIKADDFLEALQAEASIFNNGKASTDTDYVANVFSAITYDATKADESAKLVAEAMGTFASNSAAAEKIAKLALANKKGNGTELEEGDNTLDDGYYLIIDTTDVSGEYDYNNPALLQVTEELTIAPKTNKPSVDKQVLDETADAETGHTNGWGETADHAINETFQFKLTAKLPATTKFERYDTYKVVFTDTWSEGVTYEDIESVVVTNTGVSNWEFEVEEGTESDEYVLSASNTTRKMTITIPDITSIEDLDLTKEVVITVIYNAHLNEDAVVSNSETCEVDDGGDGTYDNNRNTVYLEYSNKPDASGSTDTGNLGKTPDDTVYVFTYEMPNTKVDADDNPVEGAGFKLYESDGTTEIGLIKDTTLDAYRPIKSGETKEEMFSADDTGIFNIVGLDAGTYILKETTIPDGYNKCADITVVISGTHVENQDKASATDTFSMTMNGDASTNNHIVNNVGATLPETGGIGTTIFYVLGGLLMAGAVILLVTKKKMSVEQE